MSQPAPEKKVAEEQKTTPQQDVNLKPKLGAKKGDVVLRVGARPAMGEDVAALSDEEVWQRHSAAWKQADSRFGLSVIGGMTVLVGLTLAAMAFNAPLLALAALVSPLVSFFTMPKLTGLWKAKKQRDAWYDLAVKRQAEAKVRHHEDGVAKAEAAAAMRRLIEKLPPEKQDDPAIAEMKVLLEKLDVLPRSAKPLPGRRKPGENTP